MHTNKPSRARVLMTTSLAAGTILVATSDMGWARSDGFRRATFHAGKSTRNLTPRIARNVPHSSTAPASRVSTFNRVRPIINQNPTSSASSGPSHGSAPGSTSRVSSFNGVRPIINQNPTSSASNGPAHGSAPGNTSRVSGFNNIHPIINQNPKSSASNWLSQAGAPGSTSRVSSFNRIHPIINQNPTSSAASQDHAPGSTNGVVSISNGVTKSVISNERGGLTVTSTRPGTVTVTNAKGSSVTLAGSSVSLSGAATPVKAGAGLQVAHLMNGSTVVAVNPPGKPGTVTSEPYDWVRLGFQTLAVADVAFYGAHAVTDGTQIVAGYGLLKGGLSGAYNSVESVGKSIYEGLDELF
jgi:hypothetical protein